MRILAIIPARYSSSRFPGKPLALILGKTMIERVYRQVEKSGCFKKMVVATDDQRIMDEVRRFGGDAELTSPLATSGTDRIWEVIAKSDWDAAINIQGDEPLISEKLIEKVFAAMEKRKGEEVITACRWNESYDGFNSSQVVKVVIDRSSNALYFSRNPIPYCEKPLFKGFYQHVGIYGYTRKALELFQKSVPGYIEKMENLEQLRFLELGVKIHVLITDYLSAGVDVPADIERIERMLRG